jgi:V8-like Glu-specific endopeptidase
MGFAASDYQAGLTGNGISAGYPGDKPSGSMWYQYFLVDERDTDKRMYNAYSGVYPGQSGSAVWTGPFNGDMNTMIVHPCRQ